MAVFGFGAHAQRPQAVELADRTAAWLRADGHEVRLLTVASGAGAPPLLDPTDAEGLDLVISLGGDGTMLRTVGLTCQAGVPVLGVNLGNLGYLAAIEPDELTSALARFLSGDYGIETRMTLDVQVCSGSGRVLLHTVALNDVVLQRPAGGHTVRASLSVNGEAFLAYAADALLVATPTGSTAYNLSARGPILSPLARALVVTPVAPHMLFDRSLVLDAGESVSIQLIGEREADLLVDGWVAPQLRPGDVLTCKKGAVDARLVTFGDRSYLDILKHKFNLGVDTC